MNSINNIFAICTIIIGGILFFLIFRSMLSELIKEKVLNNKDGIFVTSVIILVFIIYLFLKESHH